jgi:ethanolamine transporter EutH
MYAGAFHPLVSRELEVAGGGWRWQLEMQVACERYACLLQVRIIEIHHLMSDVIYHIAAELYEALGSSIALCAVHLLAFREAAAAFRALREFRDQSSSMYLLIHPIQ